jgi:hypothetical protein
VIASPVNSVPHVHGSESELRGDHSCVSEYESGSVYDVEIGVQPTHEFITLALQQGFTMDESIEAENPL